MEYPILQQAFEVIGRKPPFDSDVVCDVLGEAIEVLRDRHKGLQQAAELASEPLKSELLSYGAQRALFVRELQHLERIYGKVNVDDRGTVTGALHRAWFGLKGVFAKRSDQTLLEEVVAGETDAADFFVDILGTRRGLPQEVTQCLSRQCAELQKGRIELSTRCAGVLPRRAGFRVTSSPPPDQGP